MPNYSKLARNARIKFAISKVIGFIGMFGTGFVAVATYIPFHIKWMIAVPMFIVGLACAIYSYSQESKMSEYSYKAKWE
jgi:hypothetical protein